MEMELLIKLLPIIFRAINVAPQIQQAIRIGTPTVKAVETVDTCLGEIEKAVKAKGGAMLITADHGNAEQMIKQYMAGNPALPPSVVAPTPQSAPPASTPPVSPNPPQPK